MSIAELVKGHWVEGVHNGTAPDPKKPQARIVDYVFFSDDGTVVQEVIASPPGWGYYNTPLSPTWKPGVGMVSKRTLLSTMYEAQIVSRPGTENPANFAYSAKELRQKLEQRGIPWLPEFGKVMPQREYFNMVF